MPTSTTQKVQSILRPLSIQGRQKEFVARISDPVDWTIMGHSPMSRHYASKQDFTDNTLSVISQRVLTEPLRLEVTNVVGTLTGVNQDDESEVEGEVAVELKAIDATCKNGLKYES